MSINRNAGTSTRARLSMTESAQIARINRQCARIGNELMVRRNRYDTRAYFELGRCHLVNWRFNSITEKDVHLDDLEHELNEIEAGEVAA